MTDALKLSVEWTVPQKPIESTEMLQDQFARDVAASLDVKSRDISMLSCQYVNFSIGLLMLLL